MLMPDIEVVPAMPARSYQPMRAQPLVPWTPVRLIVAAWQWLVAETETGLEAPKERVPVADERSVS